jgi:5-methylcytosine-specific restriction protein A
MQALAGNEGRHSTGATLAETMSTIRREPARHQGKGPTGRNLCYCGCGQEVQGRRVNWFSQACVDSWKIKNDPQTIRAKVLERDHGVCAVCGINAEMKRRCYHRMLHDAAETPRWHGLDAIEMLGGKPAKIRKAYAKAGWPGLRRTWWEADHIVAVVEGGGQCGLDNYRTLCVRCHKRATTELRQRLARRRRAARTQIAA